MAAIGVVGAAACDGPARSVADTSASARPALVWHTVGAWSGTDSGQTGSFDVTTGALRVTWRASVQDASAHPPLTIVLHSAISGRPLQTVVDMRAPGDGIAYVQDEPRVSYFDVQAPGTAWRLTVEEAVNAR